MSLEKQDRDDQNHQAGGNSHVAHSHCSRQPFANAKELKLFALFNLQPEIPKDHVSIFSGKHTLLLLSATLLSDPAGPPADFLGFFVCSRGRRAVTGTSNGTGVSCANRAVGSAVPGWTRGTSLTASRVLWHWVL